MELWIRSQDKNMLEKAYMVKVGRYENTDKKEVENVIIINNDYIYARYKTKERALEVLDEIQKLLKPTIIMEYNSDGTMKVSEVESQPSTYVYEMPKE